MFWPDHAFALEMDDMIKYVQTIQQFHFELNNNLFIAPSDRELVKRSEYLKSIIVVQDMERGDCFTPANIQLARPGTGLPPKYIAQIINKFANKDLPAGHILSMSDVSC